MYVHQRSSALARAANIARRTAARAYVLHAGAGYEVFSLDEIEDRFASGDLTPHEFDRDLAHESRPARRA